MLFLVHLDEDRELAAVDTLDMEGDAGVVGRIFSKGFEHCLCLLGPLFELGVSLAIALDVSKPRIAVRQRLPQMDGSRLAFDDDGSGRAKMDTGAQRASCTADADARAEMLV